MQVQPQGGKVITNYSRSKFMPQMWIDKPLSKPVRVDLLVCRVLMYFTAIAQERTLFCFHFALNDNSFLFLGNAESLLSRSNLFTPVNLKHLIFSKGMKLELQYHLLLRNRNPKKEKVKPL